MAPWRFGCKITRKFKIAMMVIFLRYLNLEETYSCWGICYVIACLIGAIVIHIHCSSTISSWADLGGGVSGVATPPNGQSHSIKCSTTDVLSHANTLIYIAKCLVIVVVKF